MKIRKLLVVGLVSTVTLLGPVALAESGGGMDMRKAASDHLALLLESAPAEKIEFNVDTIDEGRQLIALVSDTYLKRTETLYGGPEKAALAGASIIEGWKGAKLRFERKTFFATKAFVVRTSDEAQMLGMLLASTAEIIHRLSNNGQTSISVRGTALTLFESFRPDSADPAPILHQYAREFKDLSGKPAIELRQYLVLE